MVWEFIDWPNVWSKILSFVMNICKSLKENVLKNVNIFSNSTISVFQIFFLVVLPEILF
jgi:hypothetical protein